MARLRSVRVLRVLRPALLALGLLAPLDVPYSVPVLSDHKVFGWSARPLHSPDDGAQVVTRTLRRARAAGLLPGDVVLAVNGATADSALLATVRARSAPGDTLDLLVRRGAEQRLIRVSVGASSASYAGFLAFVIVLALIAWVTGMMVLLRRGTRADGVVLGAALLLLPPSFFPSGISGGALPAVAARTAWQLMSASYIPLFPALLLHFTALHGGGPRILRARWTWPAIYAAIGLGLATTVDRAVGVRLGGTQALVAAVLCAALLACAVDLQRPRLEARPPSVRWLALTMAVVACTTGIQVVFATWAPALPFTEAISEIDSLALVLLPTLVAFHFFAPFGADGVWNSPRWVNTAGSLVVTGLYACAVIGTAAVVLHLSGRQLGGVEWLLFVSMLMVTFAFSPVLRHVRDLVDRHLLADWIVRESMANAFVERVTAELEVERVAARVARELPPLLGVASVELLLAGDPARSSAPPLARPAAELEREIACARERHARSAAGDAGAPADALLLPVRTADGALAGALRIGGRLDGRPIDDAGDGIHRIVTHGVAAALNNARSYLALRRARDELAEAERVAALGALAGGLAHEIKNPLASLQMGLHLLAQDGADGERLRRIHREVRRIDDLVSGLLRYTHAGSVEPPEPIDLSEIARRTIADARPRAEDRAALIGERYPEEPACVMGTTAQLRLIVANLLANAIDSIDDGGRIDVRVAVDGAHAALTVSDSGAGIAPELRERIFELNFSTKPNGTGIGLALARRETERLGGTIAVDPCMAGPTTLRLTLPRVATPTPTPHHRAPEAPA
ncbi:MAG TPA: ATP-binding protein [Gemmatimonadaceae bacterium]